MATGNTTYFAKKSVLEATPATCPFDIEFAKVTEGAFPMLKLGSVTYFSKTKELQVRFIVSAFDQRKLTEDNIAAVAEAVKGMFPGVNAQVQYIRTYTDESVLKNKVLEFFNSDSQMIFRRISDDSLKIVIDGADVTVALVFDAAVCNIVASGDSLQRLANFLSRNFNNNITVCLYQTEEEAPEEDDDERQNYIVRGSGLKLIKVRTGEKLYSRGKIDGISRLPNYIADVKSAGEDIVLCGRVSEVGQSTYRNKKHDPADPKTGPEMLPIVKFNLNDTTARIEAVCFPRSDAAQKFDALKDGDQVICTGKVSVSTFNGALSYAVNAVFRCEIDFDSIVTDEGLPVPARYKAVYPQKYTGATQQSILAEADERKVNEFLKGKTLVVFDLETTSTNVSNTEIIEIGAIKVEDGEATSTFSTLVKPTTHIPEMATEINHITDEMVSNAPAVEDVIADFYKFCYDATLVGHNVEGFDFPIVKRIGAQVGYVFHNELMDTLNLSRRYLRERSNFKLENLAKDLKLTHTDAHRALSDVEATYELLRYLIKKF